jgi:hypothetical protein
VKTTLAAFEFATQQFTVTTTSTTIVIVFICFGNWSSVAALWEVGTCHFLAKFKIALHMEIT